MTAAMSSGLSPSRSNLNVTILSLCVCSWHSTTRSTLSESCRDKQINSPDRLLFALQSSQQSWARMGQDVCEQTWGHVSASTVSVCVYVCVLRVCVICTCCTIVFLVFIYYLCKKKPNGRCLWRIKGYFRVSVPLWCAALISPSFWTFSQQSAWRPFSHSSLIDPHSHHSNLRSRRRHNCKDTWVFLENMTPKIIPNSITYNRDIKGNQTSRVTFAVKGLKEQPANVSNKALMCSLGYK